MVTMKDVWNVDMVGRTSSERTGYATQKPEALLERIVEGSTQEGDYVADFFCGSGTLASVAEKMNRRWICCDGSALAVSSTLKRIYSKNASVQVLEGESADTQKANPNVKIEVFRDSIAGSDKELMIIALKDYDLGKLPDGVDKKGIETLKLVQEKDPLQFIEYWSIDFDYDGKIYRPAAIFSKEKGVVKQSCEKLMPVGTESRICVKTVDIFGNCIYTVI